MCTCREASSVEETPDATTVRKNILVDSELAYACLFVRLKYSYIMKDKFVIKISLNTLSQGFSDILSIRLSLAA